MAGMQDNFWSWARILIAIVMSTFALLVMLAILGSELRSGSDQQRQQQVIPTFTGPKPGDPVHPFEEKVMLA